MAGLFKAGSKLGHFRIVRLLGSGGMADVYEAEDPRLGRRVALKVLPPEFSRNQESVKRFEKEVRAAAVLNHRGIVTVYEVGHEDVYHYYAMQLLTGGDLRRRIEQGMTPAQALTTLREVAEAFVHAHESNFVHRDVKPENIVFDEQDLPVLTDFGIAKALDDSARMTATGVTVGTPRYLSPEQARGKPVDARADIYSLGAILHEMLTGKPPYDGEDNTAIVLKHVSEPIPRLPGALAAAQPLLDAMMEKNPAKRMPSCRRLIEDIDALLPQFVEPQGEAMTSSPWLPRVATPTPARARTTGSQPTVITAATDSGEPPEAAGGGEIYEVADEDDAEAAPAGPPPRLRRMPLVPVLMAVAGTAIAAYVFLRPPVTAPAVQPPVLAPVDEARRAEERRLKEEAERRAAAEAAEAEARRKAEAEEAERQAEARRVVDMQSDARRRAQAAAAAQAQRQADAARQAEARRKADAETDAKRQAEAQAEAQRQAEAAAAAAAAAEAAAQAEQQAEAARQAEAKRQADAARREALLREAARQAEREREEEERAKAEQEAADEAELQRKARGSN